MNARMLLLNYASMYRQKFGLTYPIAWAKHAAIIKRLLNNFGVEVTEIFLRLHLEDTTDFVIKSGHSLETLPSQVPRYIAAYKKLKDAPPESFSDIKDIFT